jgi:hypothetical protein
MANIRKWLEDVEKTSGEPIEAIVAGKPWQFHAKPTHDENIVLSRDTGLAKLDQEFDNGLGGAVCYFMYAWTATRVYFISTFDGSSWLMSVPRHPIDCNPGFEDYCVQ